MTNLLALSGTVSTILTVAMILAMFCLPAFIVWLTKKVKFLNTIGAIALCYALGFVFSVMPIPYDKGLTQTVASVIVAVAIPLILFTVDLGGVKKLAKKTILSFSLVIISTVVVSCCAFFVANSAGLQNASQLAGMATGLYIGGTPNLYFVGGALLTGENANTVIAAANTSDFFVGGIYFLLLLTVIPPLYRRLLDGKKGIKKLKTADKRSDTSLKKGAQNVDVAQNCDAAESERDCAGANKVAEGVDGSANAVADEIADSEEEFDTTHTAEYDYKSIPKDKKSIWRLIGVVALAVGCLAVGAGLNLLITKGLDQTLYLLITVSVLGVAFSFVKPVRETKGAYQVGQYLLLIFSLGLSMSLDLSVLVKEILPILLFFACTQTACILLHFVLCKIFKIDSGTAIITSTAGIYGPPFIAPVANAAGNKKLIAPGIICGAVGLALGNFIGLGVGALLGIF